MPSGLYARLCHTFSSLTLIGCHGNVPCKRKTLNEVNKPLFPSTNPEILVKIGPLGS